MGPARRGPPIFAAGGRQPLLLAPVMVVGLLGCLAGVHLIRLALAADFDRLLLIMLGILPVRYLAGDGGMLAGMPGGVWAALPFISYAFLHADLLHLGINSAWLLAFGTPVARRLGGWRFLLFYLVCAALAAGVHVLFNAGSGVVMLGASGAIAGLMGAAFRLQLPATLDGGRRAPESLTPLYDRRFLLISLIWISTNVIFGITGFGAGEQVRIIAWDAHIGGFAAGVLLIGWFSGAGKRPG